MWRKVRNRYEALQPLPTAQINNARQTTSNIGASIETNNEDPSLEELNDVGVAIRMLLALGVLAMVIGLLLNETTSDVRVLAALGVSSETRRTIAGSAAATMRLLRAPLGTVVSHLALIAFSSSQQNMDLTAVLARSLAVIIVGLAVIGFVNG